MDSSLSNRESFLNRTETRLREIHKKLEVQDFNINEILEFQEILDFFTQDLNLSTCSFFLSGKSDLIKSLFMKSQQVLLDSSNLAMIDSSFEKLLKMFEKISGNQESDLFIHSFLLLIVQQAFFEYPHARRLLEFIQKYINGKDSLGEILLVPLIFNKAVLSQQFTVDALWLDVWEKLTLKVDSEEICIQIIMKIKEFLKEGLDLTFFYQFLKLCNEMFQEIVLGLASCNLLEVFSEYLESSEVKESQNDLVFKCFLEILKDAETLARKVKIVTLCTKPFIKQLPEIRRKLFCFLPFGLESGQVDQIDQFCNVLITENDPDLVLEMLGPLKVPPPPYVQLRIMEKGLFEALFTKVFITLNRSPHKNLQLMKNLWVEIFRILHLFDRSSSILIKKTYLKELVLKLREESLKPIQEAVIFESFQYIQSLYSQNSDFFWVILEFISFQCFSENFSIIKTELLKGFKLNSHKFRKISKIEEVIFFHLAEISEEFWPFYSRILVKCFKTKISCKIIKIFSKIVVRSKSRLILRLLTCMKKSLNSENPQDNLIREFDYFDELTQFQINQKEGLFSCKEISFVIRFKPSKNLRDCILIHLVDAKYLSFCVRISNKKIIVESSSTFQCFEMISEAEVSNKTWNFLAVSCSFKSKTAVLMKLNEKVVFSTFKYKLAKEVTFFALSLGSSIEKSLKFIGKISNVQIYRKSLDELEIHELSQYTKFNPMNISIKRESLSLSKIKNDLVFLYGGEFKSPLIQNKVSISFQSSTTKSKGNSLYNSLKSISGLDGLKSYGLEEFIEYLGILSILFSHSEVSEIVPNNFAELITCKATSFSLSLELKQNYLRFILNIYSDQLLRKFLYYYLNEPSLHCFEGSNSVEEAEKMVPVFRRIFQIDSKYFLLLAGVFHGMDPVHIKYVLRHFLEDFSNKKVICGILKVLIKAEKFVFIESVVSLVESCHFEGESEDFLNVFLMLLAHPLSLSFHASLMKIVFKEINSNFRKDLKKGNKKSVEALSFLRDRFYGIDALVECLTHFGIKSTLLDPELKVLFLDLVLCKTKYILTVPVFQKLFNFLMENKEICFTLIYNRNIFPKWLIEFYQRGSSFALALAELIFSQIESFEDLQKINDFFQVVLKDSSTLALYSQLLNFYSERKDFKKPENCAKFFAILENFKVSAKNFEKISEILEFFLEFQSNEGIYFYVQSSMNEFAHPASRFFLKTFIWLSLKSLQFTLNIQTSLEKFFEKANFFKLLNNQNKKLLNQPFLEIFTFVGFCEALYLKKFENLDFFYNFVKNAKIKEKILKFFEYNKEFFSDDSRFSKVKSKSKAFLDHPTFSGQLFNLEQYLKDLNEDQLGTEIFTQEWIFGVHFCLYEKFWIPLKKNQVYGKFVSIKDPEIENSSILKKFEEILTKVNIQDFSLEQSMRRNHLKTLSRFHEKEQNRKIDAIESILEGKYYLKNRNDLFYRWTLVKLTEKSIKLDDRASFLFRASRRFTIDLSSLDSRIFSSTIIQSPEKKATLKQNLKYLKLPCEQIKISGSYFGLAVFTDKFFQFKCSGEQKNPSDYFGSALSFTIRSKKCDYVFHKDQVSEVLFRRFIHKSSAIEIFLTTGKSFFLNLFKKRKREKVFQVLTKWEKVKIIKNLADVPLAQYREKWMNGGMSNLEYLLLINKYSGRSFHDLSQYPVFPWVVNSFSQPTLDPEDPKIYRDFTYPVAAQLPSSRSSLKKNLSFQETEKYHFGQHYSNGGIVLYYMIRLEPFATQCQLLQGGDFDHADRIFFSLETAWESSQTMSGDTKELIPELFYLPQVFENLNNFSFGTNSKYRQDSAQFVLPAWARSSWDLVRKMRKCLESCHCSANLHHWIDLVFGWKQSGEQAENSCNLFHPISYQEFYKSSVKFIEPGDLKWIVEQIYHFGQTPQKIFKEPHPKRKFIPSPSIFELWKSENKSMKTMVLAKQGDFLEILSESRFLFLFLVVPEGIKYLRFDLAGKTPSKPKDFQLKHVKMSDFFKFSVCIWNLLIATSGFHDCSSRFFDFEGELKFITTFHPTPVVSMCPAEKLFTGSDVLIAWSLNLAKHLQFVGHKTRIISVSCSDLLNIVASCDHSGNVLIHDSRSAQYLFSLNTNAGVLMISNLGFFFVFQNNGFRYFSLDGKEIGQVSFQCGKYAEISALGDSLLGLCGQSIALCDVLEDKVFVMEEQSFHAFCVAKDEKSLFSIECGKENWKLSTFFTKGGKKS